MNIIIRNNLVCKTCHNTRNQFTLIELLVVIAIIAILASMLLPALSRAREQARVVVCLGNHKQLTMAHKMYADDFDEYMVYHDFYNNFAGHKGDGGPGWSNSHPRLLNPYLGGGDGTSLTPPLDDPAAQVVRCPSDKGDPKYSWNDSEWRAMGSSYSVQDGSTGHIKIDHSTGVDSSKYRKFQDYQLPEYKIAFFTISLYNNRDWASEQTRWHGQAINNPRVPVSFIDGRAENFYFSWRPGAIEPGGRGPLNAYIRGYY